jgi:hypothetical protein
MSGLPLPKPLCVWQPEAVEIRNMLELLAQEGTGGFGQPPLEGRANDAPGRIPDDAPSRSPPAKTNGYVFEHIVVMESMLGRPMLPDGSVHHRNGVRDDNRPENLELWVRPQPSGIRKEDAIAWAREILGRFGEPG